MSKKIKFNVIIPTRERADTLLHCLRTIVSQDYENLNIIVSDNFSQDNTKHVVESFSDSRIKYINTGQRVSMSHNWEFALSHVNDGWVTIIGDDDGLLPGALAKVNEVVQKTRCKAINSKWCFYNWPDSSTGIDDLKIPLTSGFELRSGSEWLGKLMRGEATYADLPCIYTGGFVDISAINHARTKSGTFFLSMTPDVYSAIALASVLDGYVFLNEPIAIAGRSSHSNGASALGIGQNPIPAQKFFSEKNIPFHSLLLDGADKKSIPILVYEAYLQSLDLHNDYLNISLVNQLAIALSRIDPQYYYNLKSYCTKVANNNQLDMDVVENKVKVERRRLFFQRFKVLYFSFWQLNLSANQFGVKNVYDAAFLAKASYILETSYKNWKLKRCYHFFKNITQRLLNYSKHI